MHRDYLRSLRDYLVDFQHRTQPLQDTAVQQAKAAEQFEEDWTKVRFAPLTISTTLKSR